jgi:putative SOS response-associated peptidase YedK
MGRASIQRIVCGRFSLTIDTLSSIAALLGVTVDPRLGRRWRARYNVAPTDAHPIVVADGSARAIVAGGWGLPPNTQILTRVESIAPSLERGHGAHPERRCVVPADGFFEWGGPKGDRQPYWYTRSDHQLMLFAGVRRHAPDGEHFSIITTPANALVASVHDRMPAVLSHDAAIEWLARGDAKLLKTAPNDALIVRRVSKRVNDVHHDDAAYLEEAKGDEKPKGKKKQMGLFD